MIDDLLHIIILSLLFLGLFGFAEFFYHKRKIKVELTRKTVHLGTGLLTLLFPIWLSSHWSVLFLCGSFFFLLITSLKFNLLPSINNVDRKTRGSLLFPIAVYVCFLGYENYESTLYFYLPILILAICDPIAALIGKRFQMGKYKILGHTKTLIGTAAFCVSAFVVTAIGMSLLTEFPISTVFIYSFTIAFFTCLAEAISHNGYDNLTIPLTSLLLLAFI